MASNLLARVTAANERLQGRLKKDRLEKHSKNRTALFTISAAAGAASPGIMRGMFGDLAQNGDIRVRDIEVDGTVNALALVAGLAGWLDEASDYVAVYGAAGLGSVLGREVEQSLLAQRRAQGK